MPQGRTAVRLFAQSHVSIFPIFSYFRRMLKWYSCILALVIPLLVAAQSPLLIPHQGIARNGNGEPLSNVDLNARFTLHAITADGPVVW